MLGNLRYTGPDDDYWCNEEEDDVVLETEDDLVALDEEDDLVDGFLDEEDN